MLVIAVSIKTVGFNRKSRSTWGIRRKQHSIERGKERNIYIHNDMLCSSTYSRDMLCLIYFPVGNDGVAL